MLAKSKSSSPGEEDALDSEIDTPFTTFDNYLSSESNIREGRWKSSAKVNIRYYDQNAEVQEPEVKGASLLDFLVTSNFTGKKTAAQIEIGDTTIEQSKNTVDSLTRRGGQANVTFGNITVSGFGVLSKESGYKTDGLGFGFNANDHIMGASTKIKFFDQQISIKGIYTRGGEHENSMGNWSDEEGGRKGDVTGIVMTTDFFSQLFTTDFEFDTINYDHDSDEKDDTVYDKAYRIRIGGLTEIYDYDLSYKYSGPQYEVIGNQSIIRDWAGFDFNIGATYPAHTLRMLSNYSWDNVEDNSLYARIFSFTGGLDYQYSGWEKFPISLLFEHNRQKSEDEPVDTDPTTLETNTLTGCVSFNDSSWSLEFQSSYSEQDDKEKYDYDTQLFTFSVVPSYTYTSFSIVPSWSFNSSLDQATEIRTETNTLTLDVYVGFFRDIVTCEFGGTYDWTQTDSNSIDMNNTALYSRLNYQMEKLWWLENSSVALEYKFNRQEDKPNNSKFSETTLMLVLSTAIPHSF